ncbi:hypothetical protein AB0I81_15280 [Nonomuraea sp. NPDC050404]|uniref:hypothetical protein n=1 Tax=Nonomuraea sp. NPDC050404 TaxID=3155783 RepID=UPI0034037758
MRKARAVLVSAVLAAGMSLTIGAAPAHAEKLNGIYRELPECQRVGNYGDQQGWWDGWRCEYKSQYHYYFLYA